MLCSVRVSVHRTGCRSTDLGAPVIAMMVHWPLVWVAVTCSIVARAANTTWYARYTPNDGDGGSMPVVASAYGFDDGGDILHDDSGFGVPLNISGAYGWSSHPTYGGVLVLNESSQIRLQCYPEGGVGGTCSAALMVRFPRSAADRISALGANGTGAPILTYSTPSASSHTGRLVGISRRGVILRGSVNATYFATFPWSDDTEGPFLPVVFTWYPGSPGVYCTQSRNFAPPTPANLGWPGTNTTALFSDGVWFGGVPVHVASIVFATGMQDAEMLPLAEGYLNASSAYFYYSPAIPIAFSPATRTTPVAHFSFDGGNLSNLVVGSHVGAFAPWTAGEAEFGAHTTSVSYNASGTAIQSSCANNPGGGCHAGNADVLLVTSGGVRFRESTLCHRFYLLNQSTCTPHTAGHTTNRPYPSVHATTGGIMSTYLQASGPGSNVLRLGPWFATVPFETWTHMCAKVTYSSTGHRAFVTVYLDGVYTHDGLRTQYAAYTDANGTSILGHTMYMASDIFLPTVPCVLTDDVYLYGVALNDTEIAALAAAQNTAAPTASPTTSAPTGPTSSPTASPTSTPTSVPTSLPTATPTADPTSAPTSLPTALPSATPTSLPTSVPTALPSSAPTTGAPTAGPTSLPSAQPTVAPTRSPTEWYTRYTTLRPSASIGSAYGFDDAGDVLHDDSGNAVPLVINGSYGWATHPVYGGYLVLNESSRIQMQCYSSNSSKCSAAFLLRAPRSAVRRVSDLADGTPVNVMHHVNLSNFDVRLRGTSRRGMVFGTSASSLYDLQWSDDTDGPFIPVAFTWIFEFGSTRLQIGSDFPSASSTHAIGIASVFSRGVWFGGVPLHVANLVFSSELAQTPFSVTAEPYVPTGASYTLAWAAPVPVAFNPGRTSPVAYFTFEDGVLDNRVAGSHIGAFAPWQGTEAALPGWANASYNQSGTSVADFCPDNPNRWCHVGNPDVLLVTTGSVRYLESTLCYRFYHVNQTGCVPHTASYTTWRPYPVSNTTHQKSPYLQTLSSGSTDFLVNGVEVAIPFNAWTHVCLRGYAYNETESDKQTRFSVHVNGTARGAWEMVLGITDSENGATYESYTMPHAADIFLPTSPCVMTDDVYLYGVALTDAEISSIAAEQMAVTAIPTPVPSAVPSPAPTVAPTTSLPTPVPTAAPSSRPTSVPSSAPSATPSESPTLFPTAVPTTSEPTYAPTATPTHSPTADVGDVALGAIKSFAIRANESAPARVRVRTLATASRRSIYLGFSSSMADADVTIVPRSANPLNLTNTSCTSLPAGVSPVLVLALTCTATETGLPATIQITPDLSPLFRDDRAPARFYVCSGAAWGAVALASVTTVTSSSSLLLLGVPTASPVAGTCPTGKFGCQCTRDSELASETHIPLLIVGSVLVWASSVLNFLRLIAPVPGGAYLVAAVYFLGHIVLTVAITWLLPVDEYSLDTLLVSRTRNADGTVTISGDTAFRATSACLLVAIPALSILVSAWGELEVPRKPKWVPIAGTAIALLVPLSALARASSPLYIQYVVPGAILVGAAVVGLLHACSAETLGKTPRVKPWVVYVVAAVVLLLHTGALALLLVDGLRWPCSDSFAGDTRLY